MRRAAMTSRCQLYPSGTALAHCKQFRLSSLPPKLKGGSTIELTPRISQPRVGPVQSLRARLREALFQFTSVPARCADFMGRNQPSWSQLKFFKNRYLFRFMSAWIVAAPLIEHASRNVPDKICVSTLCLRLSLPFSIKISVVSTLLLLASYCVYQLCCPKLIKLFDDFSDFAKSGATANSLIGYVKEFYFSKILPRNHDRIEFADIELFYDNQFIQELRPFFKRNLAFEIRGRDFNDEIGSRGRWSGLKVSHSLYRPQEMAQALETVRFRRAIDIGRCDTALKILFSNLDIYFEFVIADGPDGVLALYVYQISTLYVSSWTITKKEDCATIYMPDPNGFAPYEDRSRRRSADWPFPTHGQLDLQDGVSSEYSGYVASGFQDAFAFFFGYIEADASVSKLEDAYDALRMHFARENERKLGAANFLLFLGLGGWLWCAGSHLIPYLLR